MPASMSPRPPKSETAQDSELNAQSSGKRQCIGNACEPCRKRKFRCDGIKPSCGRCSSQYTDCHYDLDNDMRRKGALRKVISVQEAEKECYKTISEAFIERCDCELAHVLRNNPAESLKTKADIAKQVSLGLEVDPVFLNGEPRADLNLTMDPCNGVVKSYSSGTATHSGPWTTVTADKDFIEHLLLLYFCWAHPFYFLFSEECFWNGFHEKNLRCCSPLLLNAILSLACNFTDRHEARSDPNDISTVGNHFFAEAERLLAEDGELCLTTVQALGIMSVRQRMRADDHSGWIYLSRMVDMVLNLRLHLQLPDHEDISATEAQARVITLWGCYALETSWVVSSPPIGRVSSLRPTTIKIPKPILSPNLDQKIWKPVYDPDYNPTAKFEQSRFFQAAELRRMVEEAQQPREGFARSVILHICRLSEIVNDLLKPLSEPKLLGCRLQEYTERLHQWYKDLPQALQLKQSLPALPHVCTLHIYYHYCLCRLFLPFGRYEYARQICTTAATSLLQVTNVYDNLYGLQRGCFINSCCVTIASSVFVLNMSVEPTLVVAVQAEESLLNAISILCKMREPFPVLAQQLQGIRGKFVHLGVVDLPESLRKALDPTNIPSPMPKIANNHFSPPIKPDVTSPTGVSFPAACKRSDPSIFETPGSIGAVTAGSQLPQERKYRHPQALETSESIKMLAAGAQSYQDASPSLSGTIGAVGGMTAGSQFSPWISPAAAMHDPMLTEDADGEWEYE